MYYEIDSTGKKIRPLPGYFNGFNTDLTGVDKTLMSEIQNDYIKIPDNRIVEVSDREHQLLQYREKAVKELSEKCKSKRAEILSDEKIININTGATKRYPTYLTPENVSKFIELYQDIYHTAHDQIKSALTIDDVKKIFSDLIFPTQEEIINKLREA